MARTRLSMQKIREVFRLKASRLSYRDSHPLERYGLRPKSASSVITSGRTMPSIVQYLLKDKGWRQCTFAPCPVFGGKLKAPAS
jgi:hypothetical protein